MLPGGRLGETYNVGGNNQRANLDVVQTLCALLDELRPAAKPYADLIRYVQDRPGHDRRYAIDARKIQAELAWFPAESFETGLRRTVEWYLNNGEWLANINSGAYKRWMEDNYGSRDELAPAAQTRGTASMADDAGPDPDLDDDYNLDGDSDEVNA